MPKRAATKELNHINWNQDDDTEPEDEGSTPKFASAEVMSKRAFKVGKRRLAGSTPAGTGSKSVFANFSGFGNSNKTSSDTKATFGFLASSSSTFSNTNGITDQKADTTNKEESKSVHNNSSNDNDNNIEYLSKLKGLNETVLEWIKLHVGKNPTCILSPIFNDYEKYLKEIQSERHTKKVEEKSVTVNEITTPTTSSALTSLSTSAPSKPFFPMTLFPSTSDTSKNTTSQQSKLLPETKEPSTPSLLPALNFIGSSLLPKTNNTPNIFSQSLTSSISVGDSKVSSSPLGSTTFSCGNVASSSQDGADNDKEDEGPPKNVFEPVTEEGSVFSQRVKLFLKKKDDYVDNGVGTLYIKPVNKEGSKYQAIVRADTNLGNILLNIILKDPMPSKRVGKNNVMIVCVLEVEKELKSVPVLLRVKTEADADNLLEIIKKYTK